MEEVEVIRRLLWSRSHSSSWPLYVHVWHAPAQGVTAKPATCHRPSPTCWQAWLWGHSHALQSLPFHQEIRRILFPIEGKRKPWARSSRCMHGSIPRFSSRHRFWKGLSLLLARSFSPSFTLEPCQSAPVPRSDLYVTEWRATSRSSPRSGCHQTGRCHPAPTAPPSVVLLFHWSVLSSGPAHSFSSRNCADRKQQQQHLSAAEEAVKGGSQERLLGPGTADSAGCFHMALEDVSPGPLHVHNKPNSQPSSGTWHRTPKCAQTVRRP